MKDTTEPAANRTPEPQMKKLKQARLPFQLLTSGVKNPVASSPIERKRKASEHTSDDDIAVVESAEVKENKVSQVEKKQKIINKESSPVSEINQNEKEDDKMEVDEETKPVIKTNNSKDSSQKTTTTVTPKRQRGRQKKDSNSTPSSAKSNLKIKVKVGAKTKKNGGKALSAKPSASSTDVVDLTESPRKSGQESSVSATCPAEPVGDEEKNTDEAEESSQVKTEVNKVADPTEDQTNSVEDGKKNAKTPPSSRKTSETESPEGVNKSEPSRLENKKSNGTKSQTSSSNKDTLKQASIVKLISKTSPKVESSKNKSTEAKISPKVEGSTNNSTEAKISPKVESSTNESTEELNKTSNEDTSPRQHLDNTSKDCEIPTTPSNSEETKFLSPALASSDSPASNAPSPATPLSSKKPLVSTNKKLTPKQLLKLKEKEEKMKEKERLKEEREKKKADEKQAKEEEKLRLKQEKEEEKRKEKEEKEKKKLAEIEQKNEEKRLKDEEKRLKEEEKQAKAEEKRRKEEEERKKKEEKKQIEEKKEAVKRKSMQAFASFFVKNDAKTVQVEEEKDNIKVDSYFKSFEVKADMRLAPLIRRQLSDENKQAFERAVQDVGQPQRLYLEQLRSPSYEKKFDTKTWATLDDTDDDVIFIESEKPDEEMEIDVVPEKKPEKKRHKAKLLQFHENRRPPYWGTWRKKSKFIRPRLPFNQDKTMLEYEVDSDDEWEEPEDGESLRGSEDEESQDEQYEEDNDMFVPHGYLSDGEGDDDDFDDTSPEAMKAKLKFLQMEFEAERNEKQEKLKPRLIGCVWFCNSESDSSSVGSHIAEMFLTRRAVWEGSLPVTISAPLSCSPSATCDTSDQTPATTDAKDPRGNKKKLVNDSMIPDIIKKVHGSRKKLSRLLKELLDEQEDQIIRPSKKCLADKIREMASWDRHPNIDRHCWYVKDDVRATVGLSDLVIKPFTPPTPITPKANITKFTKVLTSDERLKLLRELPSASPNDGQPSPVSSKSSKASVKPSNQSVSSPAQSVKPSNIKPTTGEKKRVPLLVSVPPGQQLPKQKSSLLNFMQTTTKPSNEAKPHPANNDNKQNCGKSEDRVKSDETNQDNNNQSNIMKSSPAASNEKSVKKRITPITLTTFVTKSAPPQKPQKPSEEDCIVLSD